ncbi:hypothetical protein [Maioricimonas sp. JC845]|uniref:hypothetical protein n=1 Tax=Maioricimonas sp. JC845 TaxID=3232138 RepID=UPI0034596BB0
MTHPFQFSADNFASNIPLPPGTESPRDEFLKALEQENTDLFHSSVASIDGALALLATGRLEQSYVLLMQAFEIALKGVLDSATQHRDAAWMARHPVIAQRLPDAERVTREKQTRDKICKKTLGSAFDEAHELLRFSSEPTRNFERVRKVRNRIMHAGGSVRRKSKCASQLVTSILPLFDELFTGLINRPLADLIGHRVARELIVAGRWFHSDESDHDDWQIAFRPFAAAWFYENPTNLGLPGRIEGEGEYNTTSEKLENLWYRFLHDRLEDHRLQQVTCHICGEPAWIFCEYELRGGPDDPSIPVSAITCTHCGLTLKEDDRGMAELHYGPITPETDGPQVADLFEHLLACQDN